MGSARYWSGPATRSPTTAALPLSVTVQAGKVGLAPASGGMGGAVSGPPGMVHQINRQVIAVVAVQGDEGIVRLNRK